MRLFKDIEHVMQTTFAIPEEEAREHLPRPFVPYAFFGRCLLQLGSLNNIFCSNFGFYAWPEARARKSLNWFERADKMQLYSLIWYDDILRATDAKLTGEVGL